MRKPSYQRLILLLMFGGTMACLGNEALPQRQSALTLLQINDVYIAKPKEGQKSGGLARVATLKKRFQSEGR